MREAAKNAPKQDLDKEKRWVDKWDKWEKYDDIPKFPRYDEWVKWQTSLDSIRYMPIEEAKEERSRGNCQITKRYYCDN